VRPAAFLDDVAGAILDGTPVDWNSVDSVAEQTDQPLVEQLKTLAALRLAARKCESPEGAEAKYWGHLRVLDCIGQGAFGEVYRAWDTRLDREVALKLLPSESVRAGSRGSAIIEEGRLLARVRHPNVVTIYGAERIGGRIGLWMEFVRGRTLEQALGDGATFSAQDVTGIGVELCRAVSAVHAAGLLHRDIKAQNVMVTEEGKLVLMDFGTGRELDGTSETNVAGTPLYLAPEVLSGGAATARSDVYGIGVLLYHLVTGSYPVTGSDLADLRRAHAERERADRRIDGLEIPRRLRRVIARAIDPNPDRRHAGADALGAALTALQHAPTAIRVAYSMAVAATIIAAATVVWNLGLRNRFLPESPPATVGAPVEHVADAPVIAVLPFKNLSSEPDSDYFVDGLTSEIIRNLAVIDGLQVRSQTSSFSFKDRPRDLRAIGEQLQVNLIVEGDVLRVGRRLRINAQLVRIAGDVPLWSDGFDRTLDDVFAIQDEISRAIVNRLRLTLGTGQRRYQTDFATYELYLRARTLVARRGTESAQQAAKLLEQVIANDPEFAPAHAGLADAYGAMSWQLTGLSFEGGLSGMRPAAIRALDLDPMLAEAHAAMGITYAREGEWENARKSFEQALEYNPTLPQIRTSYSSSTLLPLGQWEKALELLAPALTADPLSPAVRRELALAQFIGGRHDDAIANLREVLARVPDFTFANQMLARNLTASGRAQEAIAVYESSPPPRAWERWITRAYVMTGRRLDVDRLVEAHRSEHPYRQAIIYAALGDKDRTFEALDRAADLAPQRTASMLVYPEMALLRGDPRLDRLRKKLNLP
jgi:serine/threonine-protein kinase